MKINYFFLVFSCQYIKYYYFCHGELAEWSIAAVLKTVVPQGTVGSNPTFSAQESKSQPSGQLFLFPLASKARFCKRSETKKSQSCSATLAFQILDAKHSKGITSVSEYSCDNVFPSRRSANMLICYSLKNDHSQPQNLAVVSKANKSNVQAKGLN